MRMNIDLRLMVLLLFFPSVVSLMVTSVMTILMHTARSYILKIIKFVDFGTASTSSHHLYVRHFVNEMI